MRFAAFALLVAGCASIAPEAPPPERVAGCWAERGPAGFSTMHWAQSLDGQAMLGELSERPANGPLRQRSFTLRVTGEDAWVLCEPSAGGACWHIAEESRGSLEGGRAFIDRYRDRLHISVVGADGRDQLRFTGRSEACS